MKMFSVIILLMLLGCGAQSATVDGANESSDRRVDATTTSLKQSRGIDEAKAVIDSHLEQILFYTKQIESSPASTPEGAAVRQSFAEALLRMAEEEAQVYKALEPRTRREGREYAQEVAGAHTDRIYAAVESAGFPLVTSNANAVASAQCDKRGHTTALYHPTEEGSPLELAQNRMQYTYGIGFLVCHRKCCANNAGNGIAAGIGCWDCDDRVISGSCPSL